MNCLALLQRLLLATMLPMSVAAQAQLDRSEVAPANVGTTRAGQQVSLADQPGKVHAVTFWASWCGPCLVELPMLESLQRVLGPDKIRVIAVNIESRELFRNATRQMSDWQVTLTNDPYKDAQRTYKGGNIPHLTIVGRDGKVRRVFIGYSEASLREVVAAVADAVNE